MTGMDHRRTLAALALAGALLALAGCAQIPTAGPAHSAVLGGCLTGAGFTRHFGPRRRQRPRMDASRAGGDDPGPEQLPHPMDRREGAPSQTPNAPRAQSTVP